MFLSDRASARRRAVTIAADARSTPTTEPVTGQIRGQERDVAATAAHIKDSHSRDDAGIEKELSCDRFYEAGLRAQTPEFTI